MAGSLARMAFAALVMGGVSGALASLLAGFPILLTVGVAVAAGAAVYAAVSLAIGAAEPRAVWRHVRYRRSSL